MSDESPGGGAEQSATGKQDGRRARVWRYTRWDGSSEPDPLSGEDILDAVSDDLLYHGDLDAALRRLLQHGFSTPGGRTVQGLRSLVERLDAQRAARRASSSLSGLFDEVRARLDRVIEDERSELEREAARGGRAGERAAERRAELALLPDGVAAQIAALASYDFVSDVAREGYAELRARLVRDMVQAQLDRAAAALAAATPADRAHLREGLAALSTLLDQRAQGRPLEPSFEQFMERFGDLFPGGAASLEELVSEIARQMAAASSLVASMSDDQRAELAALGDALLSDDGLAEELERLGTALRAALPRLGWDRGVELSGDEVLDLPGASELLAEIGELDRLAAMLRSVTQPGELAELDPLELAELLGPDVLEVLEVLASLTRRLEQEGLVGRTEGRLAVTPRGLRRLGARALDQLFTRLQRDRVGEHRIAVSGTGADRSDETKAYEPGDLLRLDVERTLRNAIARAAAGGGAGGKAGADPIAGETSPRRHRGVTVPIRLAEEDFEVERSEHLSGASTVLAVDLSLSMPMRDNFLAAKKVAISLQALIASRYPRDYLGLVGFSATARVVAPHELPELSWDFAYGTNLQHALALSRSLLRHRSGAKQVIVVTDGEPTAHVGEDGDVLFDYPTTPETLAATLAEVARCTRAGITINTFVLDATGELRAFVEKMTRVNRGRAFFTTPDELGAYVLLDFVEHRSGGVRRLAHG